MPKNINRQTPMFYFQIETDGTEVINIFETMKQVEDYFNRPGLNVRLSRLLNRHPRAQLRVEGYFWAVLPQEYCSNLSDEEITEEALLQVQDLVFRFLVRNISLRKIDNNILLKLNEILKRAHMKTR